MGGQLRLCTVTALCRTVLLAAGVLEVACGHTQKAAPPPQDASTPVIETIATDAPPDKTSAIDQHELASHALEILQLVAKARNLEPKNEVQVDTVTAAQVRNFVQQTIYEYITPSQLTLQGRIDAALGILPVGSDPEAILLDILEDGILGYYDPKKKTIFVVQSVPTIQLTQVLGHELAHGLQDMHFGLSAFQTPLQHHSDAELARTFFIEGGAQAAYLAWLSADNRLDAIDDQMLDTLGNQALDMAPVASEFPILWRGLELPYTAGTATVVRLVRSKGWEAQNALYGDPPQTTEQMLHVDKLISREPAREIELDFTRLEEVTGGSVVWFDELGEASLLAMLAEVCPSIVARRAAAGWGGSMLAALEPSSNPSTGSMFVIAAIAWDSVSDARDFEALFAEYLNKKTPGLNIISRRGDTVLFGTNMPSNVSQTAIWSAVARPRKRR